VVIKLKPGQENGKGQRHDGSESPQGSMPYVQARAGAQYPACSSQLDLVHAQLFINKSSFCSSGCLLPAPNVASRVLRSRPCSHV